LLDRSPTIGGIDREASIKPPVVYRFGRSSKRRCIWYHFASIIIFENERGREMSGGYLDENAWTLLPVDFQESLKKTLAEDRASKSVAIELAHRTTRRQNLEMIAGALSFAVVLFPITALGFAILANLGWNGYLGLLVLPASMFTGIMICACFWGIYECAKKFAKPV
jgi:hypothetical protein